MQNNFVTTPKVLEEVSTLNKYIQNKMAYLIVIFFHLLCCSKNDCLISLEGAKIIPFIENKVEKNKTKRV